jgi:hypothetical protein
LQIQKVWEEIAEGYHFISNPILLLCGSMEIAEGFRRNCKSKNIRKK